jgi:hypothetical protein
MGIDLDDSCNVLAHQAVGRIAAGAVSCVGYFRVSVELPDMANESLHVG